MSILRHGFLRISRLNDGKMKNGKKREVCDLLTERIGVGSLIFIQVLPFELD